MSYFSTYPIATAFIINPIAGGVKKTHLEAQIVTALAAEVFQPHFYYTRWAGDAAEQTTMAVADGCQLIVAVGGDGTINEIATALLHTPAVLGILPLGSGNGLARHLGISKKIPEALAQLSQLTVHTIDIGCVNQSYYFYNTWGAGFSGTVSRSMQANKTRGWRGYVQETLKQLRSIQHFKATLQTPTHHLRGEWLLIEVSNGSQFGYEFRIAPEADINDQLFTVTLIKKAAWWRYVLALPHLLSGTVKRSPLVTQFAAPYVQLRIDIPTDFHIDGEGAPLAAGDLHLGFYPAPLRIIY